MHTVCQKRVTGEQKEHAVDLYLVSSIIFNQQNLNLRKCCTEVSPAPHWCYCIMTQNFLKVYKT